MEADAGLAVGIERGGNTPSKLLLLELGGEVGVSSVNIRKNM